MGTARRVGAAPALLMALSVGLTAALSGCSLLTSAPEGAAHGPSASTTPTTAAARDERPILDPATSLEPPPSSETPDSPGSPGVPEPSDDPASAPSTLPLPRTFVPRWPQFVAKIRRDRVTQEYDVSAARLLYAADDRGASGPRALPPLGPGILVLRAECSDGHLVELAVHDGGARVAGIRGPGSSGTKAFPGGIADGVVTVRTHGAKRYAVAVMWVPTT